MAKRLKKANDENDDLKNENSKLKNEIKDLNKMNKDLEKIMEDNKKLIEDHCSKVCKDSLYFCDGPIRPATFVSKYRPDLGPLDRPRVL